MLDPVTTTTVPAITMPLDPRLQALAEHIKAHLKVAGNTIQVQKSGLFKLAHGEEVDELTAVILDYRFRNAYYTKAYRQGEYTAPVCFAMGIQPNDALIPLDKSPQRQAAACVDCAHNQFGSHPTGRGKACSQGIQLALMYPDPAQGDQISLLRCSATALKDVSSYLVVMTERFGHPLRCLTRFRIDTTPGYPRVTISYAGPNTQHAVHLEYLIAAEKALEAEPLLETPAAAPAPLKGSGRAARH